MPIEFRIQPYKFYAFLSDTTLTTKIREESWKLQKLFPAIKGTKRRIRANIGQIKRHPDKILALRHDISALSSEIRAGIKDIKLVSYYNSTILYLYYKLLQHVMELCENALGKLETSQTSGYEKTAKGLSDAKKAAEHALRKKNKSMMSIKLEEHVLEHVYSNLVGALENMKWEAEKKAQHEFSFHDLTLSRLERLNRLVKVKAMAVKAISPVKASLLNEIGKNMRPEDVHSLAFLILRAIKNVKKDFFYAMKMLSKFESEVKMLKKTVAGAKRKVLSFVRKKGKWNNIAGNIFKQWDETIAYLDSQIDRDLMEMYRNIFIEYKRLGTEKINASN